MKFQTGDIAVSNSPDPSFTKGKGYRVNATTICPCGQRCKKEKILLVNNRGRWVWKGVEDFEQQKILSLEDQLTHAVESEDYEQAAKLRDQINKQYDN